MTRLAVTMACVAPAGKVISLLASCWSPTDRVPDRSQILEKPCPMFTAARSTAFAEVALKMVVPASGRRERNPGHKAILCPKSSWCFNQIFRVARHGSADQGAVEVGTDQLGKFIHKIAQVGAAFKGNTGHIHAK